MNPIAIAAIVPTTPTEGNPPPLELPPLLPLPPLVEPLLFPELLPLVEYGHPV